MAPGVGLATDAYIVFKDKIEQLIPELFTRCSQIYEKNALRHQEIDQEAARVLQAYIIERGAIGLSATQDVRANAPEPPPSGIWNLKKGFDGCID